MKKLLATSALALALCTTSANAAVSIKGTLFFFGNAPTTAHSAANTNANFQFDIPDSFTPAGAGDFAFAAPLTITNFLYTLGSSTVPILGIPQVQFYKTTGGGMFSLSFGGGHSIDIFGTDIGSDGSVGPSAFYFPPAVSAVKVNFTDAIVGTGTVSVVAPPAVPEPSTWAMMLLGFGLVGMSIRRRQNVQVSFA